jgi:hypothetical protein
MLVAVLGSVSVIVLRGMFIRVLELNHRPA